MAKAVLMQAGEPDQSEAHEDQDGEEATELSASVKSVERMPFCCIRYLPCGLLPEKLVCHHFALFTGELLTLRIHLEALYKMYFP